MSIRTLLCELLCPPPCDDEPVERPFNKLYARTGDHVKTVLRRTYPSAQIKIADRTYSTVSLKEFDTWIRNDMVSARKYYKEYFDCDNFARWLRCAMFKVNLTYKTEITMLYCEGDAPDGYHAFNIFIDNDDNVYVVEPQDDYVIPYTDSLYKPDFIQL